MNVALLFRQACAAAPERLALATRARRVTFAEMGLRVRMLASALRAAGIGRGSRVAIVSRNTVEYIELFWAAIDVGAIAVPINFRLADPELERLLDFTEAAAYFCSPEFESRIRMLDKAAANRLVVHWGDDPQDERCFERFLASAPAGLDAPPANVAGDDPYAVIFTGGTSGRPKGVPRSHRNAIASVLMQPGNELHHQQRVVLACTPLFHVAGQLPVFALATGSTVVLLDRAFDPHGFLELVEEFKVNAAFVVPSMVGEIAALSGEGHDTSSLRELRSGGAPLPLEVANRLVQRFPRLRLFNGAGSTEAGTYASGAWEELGSLPFGCIGRPPIGQEVRLVDEAGEACPAGAIGEILVRGSQVAPGYWKDEEATARTFRGGWVHSGDLGWIDEAGRLYLVDRKSEIIISGGENVYAREVEEALHAVPCVKEAAVVAVPDEKWGEVPAAVVVLQGADARPELVQQALAATLAAYKRPKHYIAMEALPRTTIGKVDKRAVKALVKERLNP